MWPGRSSRKTSQTSEQKHIEMEVKREKVRNRGDPARRANMQRKEKVKETIIM